MLESYLKVVEHVLLHLWEVDGVEVLVNLLVLGIWQWGLASNFF